MDGESARVLYPSNRRLQVRDGERQSLGSTPFQHAHVTICFHQNGMQRIRTSYELQRCVAVRGFLLFATTLQLATRLDAT